MAKGLSAALPLIVNEQDGPYRLNKIIPELARQNLKMVILTNPGERVMIPEFGVGLSSYIFENDSPQLRSDIIGRISSQVSEYLPYIFLENISVNPFGENDNQLIVSIQYFIPNESGKQNLSIILNNDSL
jgi:phage baseplate assembly protein W